MLERDRRYEARRRLWNAALEGVPIAGVRVLDAGLGEGHCTRFLAERFPKQLVSVTCIADEIAPARQRLGEWARTVDFQVADLTALPTSWHGRFDVVVGDFLIAAVAAYRPFREVDAVRALVRAAADDGWIVLTGWEATPPSAPHLAKPLREAFALRDAVHHMLGEKPFREHPRFWMEDRLREAGAAIVRSVALPDIHFDFSWFARQVSRWIDDLPTAALRSAFAEHWAALAPRIVSDAAFSQGVTFGQLHAVTARKGISPTRIVVTTNET